jgi:hypothetical protein
VKRINNRVFFFAFAIVSAVMVSSFGSVASSHALAQTEAGTLAAATESQLRICLDENRRTKGIVDLVLLLDNSTSLNLSTGTRPTDPNETRFVAVESMLSAIGRAIKDSSARVNFGLITFAAQSEVRIPLGNETISAQTARDVAKRVREEAPSTGQKNGTNFVNALNAALKVFEQDSSSKHCRVLVWFTDGMIAHGGGSQETTRLLNALPELTCGDDGFAQRVRDLGINPFVILLKPSDGADPLAKSKSYELMQQVTGDRSLPPGFDVTVPSQECDELMSPAGEVYDANNADALAPYFVDIGRALSGGQAVDDCPIPASGGSVYQSPQLPAARFLSWISLVVFDGDQLPSLSSLQISMEGKSSSLDTYFLVEPNRSDYLLTPRKGTLLEKGWTLIAPDGLDGACLRAKIIDPVSVTTFKSGGAPAQVVPDPDDEKSSILTTSDLEAIEYFNRRVPITLEDLFVTSVSQEDITALIDIDPSERIAPEGLSVFVKGFSTEPQVENCVQNGLTLPTLGVARAGELERGRDVHEFVSTTCTVDLRFAKKDLTIDATGIMSVVGADAAAESSQGCRSLRPSLVIDGVMQDQLSAKLNEEREYAVSLQVSVGTTSFDCQANSEISMSYTGLDGSTKVRAIPITVDIARKVPPNQWLPVLMSLVAVLLAALLSLLLLNLLNRIMTSLPDDSKLYGYEIAAEIGIRGTGQVVAQYQGADVSKLAPQVQDLRPPKGSKDELSVHTMKLRRQVPGLFKPFTEPRAEVVGEKGVVYRQRTSRGGLAVPFKQAVMIRPSREKPKDPELIAVLITILVPRSGSGAGVAGVSRLLEGQSFKEAIREFLDLRKSSSAENVPMNEGHSPVSATGPSEVEPSGVAPRAVVPPPPPRPVRPPDSPPAPRT